MIGFTKLAGYRKEGNGTTGATGFGWKFNIVECTTNAHCTSNSDANPNTAKCNLNITTNFPQNTCIDSVKPQVNADILAAASGRTAGPDVVLGTTDDVPWFKAGTYQIPVTDSDNAGGLVFTNLLTSDHWHNHGFPGGNHQNIISPLSPAKGDYELQLDYYENTDNAKVEFTYWVEHGLGLTLNKSQYNFAEDIALTAKYSGLDQRFAYRVYFTWNGADAQAGGAIPCDISAGALGDPRGGAIGTCNATFTRDIFVNDNTFPAHRMCAFLTVQGRDVNSDCVDFTVVGFGPPPPRADTIAPTITIGEIKRTHSGLLGSKDLLATPETPGTDSLGRQWLRDGQYEVSISVTDNTGGFGVDTNYRPVIIRSIGADNVFGLNPATGVDDDKKYSLTRTVENKFSVWVGSPDSSLNDCVDEKENKCRIYVYARDLAGNETVPKFHNLNIDYTPPTAQ